MSPNKYSFAARLIVLTVAFFLSSKVLGYAIIPTTSTRLRLHSGLSMSTIYEQMLQQAQATKLKGGQQLPPRQSQPNQHQQHQQQKQQRQEQEIIDVGEEEDEDNEVEEEDNQGLPFSDALYDDLKFVISKLSARMKSDTALSKSDLERFKKSVNSIIKDSKKHQKSSNSPGSAAKASFLSLDDDNYNDNDEEGGPMGGYDLSQGIMERQQGNHESSISAQAGGASIASSASSASNDPFRLFRGSVSTWDVPGSEDMSTEEFYAAVNQRISSVKETLKNSIGTDYNPSNNYEEQLNSMNRANKRLA